VSAGGAVPRTAAPRFLTPGGARPRRKLSELERELRGATQHRQRYAAGHECCCCTCVFHDHVIPARLRAWDLS